jgi:hypothetical protein
VAHALVRAMSRLISTPLGVESIMRRPSADVARTSAHATSASDGPASRTLPELLDRARDFGLNIFPKPAVNLDLVSSVEAFKKERLQALVLFAFPGFTLLNR